MRYCTFSFFGINVTRKAICNTVIYISAICSCYSYSSNTLNQQQRKLRRCYYSKTFSYKGTIHCNYNIICI